jgi:hypothetical protein
MQRPKGHMSDETLAKCIVQAKVRGQTELVVHHFGEPLLHPRLKERLTQIAGAGMAIQFSTNGLLLEEQLPVLLGISAKITITLSMHQWSRQPPSAYFNALKGWQYRTQDTNLLFQKAFNAFEDRDTYNLHKWSHGDDTPWDFHKNCFFLSGNWGVVLWNGDIVSCCVDAEGESVFANIHDPASVMARTVAWRGCDTCDVIGKHYKEANKRQGGRGTAT